MVIFKCIKENYMVFEIKLKILHCFTNSGENLLLFVIFNTLFPLLFSMHYITFNETWCVP